VRDEASLQVLREAAQAQDWPEGTIHTGSIVEATQHLRDHPTPRQLMVEVASAAEAPAQLGALADVCAPGVRLIVTSTVNEFSFFRWLKDMGVDEYLLQPFKAEALTQALTVRVDAPKAAEAPKKQGEVTVVLGARGGVGATTLATNLAGLLAREHQRTTLLLDLDAHFGSAAMMLDLEPSRGIATLFDNPDRVDGLFLDRVLIRQSDHLFLLSAEEPLKEALSHTTRTAEVLLPRLREKFAHTIIDLPRALTPLTRALLAGADRVVLVTEPSLTGLRDLLRLQDYLKDALQRPLPLVFSNRGGLLAKTEVKRTEFEKHFGRALDGYLPFLPEALTAAANGQLLIDLHKGGALQPLRALAAKLAGEDAEEAPAAPRPGLLGKLVKGK
jgi:pilus assembly protein CpaE